MTVMDAGSTHPAGSRHFLVADKGLVTDDFEDETVVIDIDRGIYFSLQGITILIWKTFQTPQAVSSVLDEAAAAFGDEHCSAIRQSIEELVTHDLLVVTEPAAGDPERLNCFAGVVFTPPVLHVFNELSELIAIDPVHEVDEAAGWPVRPAKLPNQA